MEQPSLFSPDVHDDCVRRIERLTADTLPEWGVMSAAQMLSHCADVQEVMNGSRELEGTPLPMRLLGPLIRRMVVSGRPYPKGSRTHPQYLQTEDRVFDAEKRRLLTALEEFRATEHGPTVRHALFGEMTRDERGWSSYKHLDHHLRQFGV